MSGERGPLALSGCRRGCPRAEGLPPHALASFLVPPKMNVISPFDVGMDSCTGTAMGVGATDVAGDG